MSGSGSVRMPRAHRESGVKLANPKKRGCKKKAEGRQGQSLGRPQDAGPQNIFAAFGDALLAPLPLETQTQFRRLWHNFGNTLRGVQRACHNGVRQIAGT